MMSQSWSEQVQLRDGTQITLRPVRTSDAEGLVALHDRLSPESLYYRFLEVRKELTPAQAEAFAHVDYQGSMAIVATIAVADDQQPIIAVARYGEDAELGEGVAEVAVIVEDPYQGLGLGTRLLRRLTLYAKEHGVRSFRASVHQSNRKILSFIERSGLPTEHRLDGSVWDIRVDLEDFPAQGLVDSPEQGDAAID